MPSFVNLGAYVGEGTMVDTWATVGSCAQIGKHVHLSGGVGIGGVLEPMQAGPTIIEDNCFIGARSEVVEGCIIREGSVLGMGVYIGKSTKIVDRATGEVMYGEVPPYSVVVAGSMPSRQCDDGERPAGAASLLRRHRQARRRADPLQDRHQRAAARLMTAGHRSGKQTALFSREAARRLAMSLPFPPDNSTAMTATDPVANLQTLIRCPSVTPAEGGALSALDAMLSPLGFKVDKVKATRSRHARHRKPLCPPRQRRPASDVCRPHRRRAGRRRSRLDASALCRRDFRAANSSAAAPST